MTKKLGPALLPLDPEYQEAVLSCVVVPEEGASAGVACTVGDLLKQAQACLRLVNEMLASDPMLILTARNLMKHHKKRGHPCIVADVHGTVSLRINYGDSLDLAAPALPRKLPSLRALRKEAEEHGLDISHLGRQKRKIMDLIIMARDVRDNHNHENPDFDPMAEDYGDRYDDSPTRRLRDEVSESVLPEQVRIPKSGGQDGLEDKA